MRAAGRGGFPRGGPVARLAAVVGLLMLAALGSAAREVAHLSTGGMLTAARPVTVVAGVIVVAAGCLVLAGVLVMLARRRQRHREDESAGVPERVGPWWARALALIAALGLFAFPIAAVIVMVRGLHGVRRPGAAPPPLVPVVPHLRGPVPSSGVTGTAVLWLAAVAAVTIVAVSLLWLRHRRRAAAAPHARVAARSPLAVAVAAGSSALGATAGAREAIIACYVAMEDALAAAGSPRRLADTPEELLRRAVGGGIVRTPAARRLTALFREARFSPHEVAEAQRHAARSALDDISHDLAGGS
ncbi:MAG TPA: DUF4129 domain-containing protein [Streptosporangiaceae bacterium]|nr:DUF4129 domain-containing protein [Streptosporangiaceae bacterium]